MTVKELTRYCRDLGWRDAPALPDTPPADTSDSPVAADDLESVCRRLAGCTRCRLSERRRTIVFGEGGPSSKIMFIGEGPGAEEDRTGRPFVGQAGQLLDEMIFALGFDRAEVYISNVVKCRPPSNRDPQEDEMSACSEFLDRQIELIAPRVLVTLGKVAARRLTDSDRPMGALRGRWASYRGIPLMPTFHPAYLLRNESAKRSVWQDLRMIRQHLDDALSS